MMTDTVRTVPLDELLDRIRQGAIEETELQAEKEAKRRTTRISVFNRQLAQLFKPRENERLPFQIDEWQNGILTAVAVGEHGRLVIVGEPDEDYTDYFHIRVERPDGSLSRPVFSLHDVWEAHIGRLPAEQPDDPAEVPYKLADGGDLNRLHAAGVPFTIIGNPVYDPLREEIVVLIKLD